MATRRASSRNFNNPKNRFNLSNIAIISSAPAPRSPYTMAYLVIGGGGGGGSARNAPGYPSDSGGGGGAGGTNYTYANPVYAPGVAPALNSNINVTVGNVYTISVGAGGAASLGDPGVYYPQLGAYGSGLALSSPGNPSNIFLNGASIVSYDGGGGGGSNYRDGVPPSPPAPTYQFHWGQPGGMGGGGSGAAYFGTYLYGPGGTASPGQGFGGGLGVAGARPAATPNPAGGGGGAESAGTGGNSSGGAYTPSATIAGAGGGGLAWPFTGTYRAGGGGGGYGPGNASIPAQGNGSGVVYNSVPGVPYGGGGRGGGPHDSVAGYTNHGGGGGGGAHGPAVNSIGAAGGSGIVQFAMPTPSFSGTYTGSNVVVTTPPASPGNTVISFYSSGTYTG